MIKERLEIGGTVTNDFKKKVFFLFHSYICVNEPPDEVRFMIHTFCVYIYSQSPRNDHQLPAKCSQIRGQQLIAMWELGQLLFQWFSFFF